MKLLNAQQIKELEDFSIKERGITSLDLMEEAARNIALFLSDHYTETQKTVIFCGAGNNGGDGVALARILSKKGYTDITVYLFNTNLKLSDNCATNCERLKTECPGVSLIEVTQQFDAPKLDARTLVIDALFGIGLSKPLSGGFAALVQLINASPAEVVSIDMPSGLMCEDNTLNSPSAIVKADITLTIGSPKLALILPDSWQYTGLVYVLGMNLSARQKEKTEWKYAITEHHEIKAMLHRRNPFGHKGTFGNALLVAGKYGMAGAAVLAAKACLKAGAGKITICTPKLNNDILQTAVPEAVLLHDESDKIFTRPVRNGQFEAVAIGPGIGTDERTCLAFIEQVSHTDKPLIIDADGINILGNHKGWITQVPRQAVFTPHPGEMKRLGICNADPYSLLNEAVTMSVRHHFFIILKGHYTAVCTPEGKVYFNPTGNNGMGTAGSGDVLTGILLALTAQGYDVESACRLGVYLHGMAGDLAASALGEHSLTATDIIQYLPQAFRELERATPCLHPEGAKYYKL